MLRYYEAINNTKKPFIIPSKLTAEFLLENYAKINNLKQLSIYIILYTHDIDSITLTDVMLLIYFFVKKYGLKCVNTIFNDFYQCERGRINNIINYILKLITIDYDKFLFGCSIAHYDLIEKAFQAGIKPNKISPRNKHPLLIVIDSGASDIDIIKIIDLFCKYGLNIIDFIHTEYIFISCRLPIIKHIIKLSNNYNYLFIHDICASIKYIDYDNYEKFTELVDFMIQKMIEDYWSVNIMNSYRDTPLHIICWCYIKLLPHEAKLKRFYEYLITQLLIHGGDITIKNFYDNTPLYFDTFYYEKHEKDNYHKLLECINRTRLNYIF
jgi:hypothetical protein